MNTDKEINIFLEGKKIPITFYHPLTQMTEKIYEIFLRLGYSFFESSEIETEENNFNLLNMPRFHPARTMHDTFYLNDNLLLRTHTTNIQPYLMKKNINKELRVITMGKVYRRDNDDPSHTHQFMQFDCFVVEKETKFTHSFAHLKGTIEFFIKEIFRKKKIRFRPSYFPFTEPSVELDIECICLKNKKCNICKGTKWIEIAGAGLINPYVLKKCGFDNKKFGGYAFAFGIERLLMIKHRIKDIRDFYLNDIRFLKSIKKV